MWKRFSFVFIKVTYFYVLTFLTLPAQYAEQGLWNGRASVLRLSLPSIDSSSGVRRGLLLRALREGDIDRCRRSANRRRSNHRQCHVDNQGTGFNTGLFNFFLQRFYRAMLCIRGTSHGPVSVCLSVCPSQVGVLLKRLNIGSHKQHHTIAQEL